MARDVIKALEVIELTGKTATLTPANNNKGLTITNPGTGHGLYIDQNGNAKGLFIDSESTTVASSEIAADALTGGAALYMHTASSSFTGNLLDLVVDHGSAAGDALQIRNEGTGKGIFIDQNGNGDALSIDNAGTAPSIKLTQSQDVEIIDLSGCSDGGSSNTTLAESIKVKMPGGGTGYINLYT